MTTRDAAAATTQPIQFDVREANRAWLASLPHTPALRPIRDVSPTIPMPVLDRE